MNIYNTLEENYIKFENYAIHVIIDINEKIWFKANDLANALGYIDTKDALKQHIDKNNKIQLKYIKHNTNVTGHPQTSYINESGMYGLILSSKLPKAKKINNWVTNNVLPSIRKFGFYKLKKEKDNEIQELQNKLNYIEKEYNELKKELKKEKYPDGGVVYIIDYNTDTNEIYRIGMTGDMNLRKKIYDTHSLYKKNVIEIVKSKCPIRLESCIRSMLYEYRYKNKKDFFVCTLKTIKKAIKICLESFECIIQNGGTYFDDEIGKLKKKKQTLLNKINKLNMKLEFI